jgi:hypothetical protein
MVQMLRLPVSRDWRAVLGPLDELAGRCPAIESAVAGTFSHAGRDYSIPRYRLRGPAAGGEPIRIGLFSGIHGDEPAGVAALVDFAAALAARPERASAYELWIYPVCNPVGCDAQTRENGAGRDLNREFWRGSAEPEVGILEAELRARRFQGIVTLHADDTSDGLYGYAHGRLLNEELLKPALRAAARELPCNPNPTIDGFAAREGVISGCFEGVLSAPPAQRPRPFDIIFETPAREAIGAQARAAVAALDAIIEAYRGFIAYAADL